MGGHDLGRGRGIGHEFGSHDLSRELLVPDTTFGDRDRDQSSRWVFRRVSEVLTNKYDEWSGIGAGWIFQFYLPGDALARPCLCLRGCRERAIENGKSAATRYPSFGTVWKPIFDRTSHARGIFCCANSVS